MFTTAATVTAAGIGNVTVTATVAAATATVAAATATVAAAAAAVADDIFRHWHD